MDEVASSGSPSSKWRIQGWVPVSLTSLCKLSTATVPCLQMSSVITLSTKHFHAPAVSAQPWPRKYAEKGLHWALSKSAPMTQRSDPRLHFAQTTASLHPKVRQAGPRHRGPRRVWRQGRLGRAFKGWRENSESKGGWPVCG